MVEETEATTDLEAQRTEALLEEEILNQYLLQDYLTVSLRMVLKTFAKRIELNTKESRF